MAQDSIDDTASAASSASSASATPVSVPPVVTKKPFATCKGPLGPVWQPVYDWMYTINMWLFNLPHTAAITVAALAYAQWYGYIHITPIMPPFAIFIMARVPFVGLAMSMSLHRYFAHQAFSTSRVGQFAVAFLGSMAMQGGVLWWSSKHRRHHKHCDEPKDPHSWTQTSFMNAWLWWMYDETHVDWAFVVPRYKTPEMLFINLFFFVPSMIVTASLVPFVGFEWAMFLCWIPGLFCALATSYFNVEYHPDIEGRKPNECLSINKPGGDKGIGPIDMKWIAKKCPWLFEPLVGEAYHDDHHANPSRAHRPGFDVPYTAVLKPLAKLGLIWDLQQPLPTDDFASNFTQTFPIVGLQARE